MKYTIKELIYTHDVITEKIPVPIQKTDAKIAIIVHAFYIDIFKEIENYLVNIETPYDLFVSISENTEEEAMKRLFKNNANLHLYITENRGRDVLPFLQIMNIIGTDTYDYICKLHTKKTDGSALGTVWRELLYFDLIGSKTIVSDNIHTFEEDNQIGIITGKNTILDVEDYMYENKANIDMLAKMLNIDATQNYLFAAGTMFWMKPSLLNRLLALLETNKLHFEEELGQTDHTLAHAIERVFGLLCHEKSLSIRGSTSDYTTLDRHTLDALASLVLTQEYIDIDTVKDDLAQQDTYIEKLKMQIEKSDNHINILEKHSRNMEALAESMRIKSRLKRLIPSRIKSKVFKLWGLAKTVKNNPALLKKVFYYAKRGEIAYLITKIREKSNTNLTKAKALVTIEPKNYLLSLDKKAYALGDIVVDIIIPVYNGYEFLEPLFDSVEKNTSSPYRLIVINDCSPDEQVKPYLLQRLKKHPTAIFIDHEENQGFLKSVNEAYTHTSNHFVLLNTDTEVPSFWLERLMYPILHMDKVASTTPFTNSGEIASFPNFVADNNIFEGMPVEALDAVFKEVNPEHFYAEVPTGVGFCMGVNYTLTKNIGMFAEDTFGKGYGEENDWCQRAIKQGYINLIVPNLFVYHKHGGSFTAEEKKELLKVNATKLLKRHPNYEKDVTDYIQSNPHETLRELLVLMASDKKIGTHLIFDHDLGGGANIYTRERIETYLAEEKSVILVRYDFYANCFKVTHQYKDYYFAFKVATLDELKVLLNKLHIKELFLNNLVSYKNIFEVLEYLALLAKNENTKLIIPIHDFYSLSPSYNLMDAQGKHDIYASLDNSKMKRNKLEWRNFYTDIIDMPRWHMSWSRLFENTSQILTFSNSSKNIFLKAYPSFENKIDVIPHIVTGIEPLLLEKNLHKTTTTIGVLGGIDHIKGATIIKEMVKLIEKDNLDINVVVIGEITEQIHSNNFKVTGRYERENLENLIHEHDIDIFLIPSIWPETFSYTTQEIMMMELPLMVFDLGAPAERVKTYDKGYTIEDISAKSVLNKVTSIYNLI